MTMKKSDDMKRCYKYFSKFAWEHNKAYYLWLVLSFVINTLGPFVSIIGTERLVDEISPYGSRNTGTIIFWITFLCVGMYLYQVIGKMCSEHCGRMNENFYRILTMRLSLTSMDMKFANTEDTKVLDVIKNAERALNESGHVNGLMSPLFNLISNIFVAAGVIGYTCTKVPWLVIPIVVAFFSNFFLNRLINKIRKKYFEVVGNLERGSDYYNTELNDARYAKDIRLYGSGDIFVRKYHNLITRLYETGKKYSVKILKITNFNVVIRQLCNTCIYLLIGIYALKKRITIGTFTALFQATSKFNNSLWGIIDSYTGINYTVSVLKFYIDFTEKIYVEKEAYTLQTNVPEKCKIEFRNVSFKYPNTDRYILKNISTVIREGEHLSIVGQNGAGKTTFIKLLCKLYNNYEGDILVNDQDIRNLNFDEYVNQLSVVFQDFRLFAFQLKENITLFKNSGMDLDYVYKTSGIDEWIDSLPSGDETYIYKMFQEDGVEPSGGQGQKLAIARAFYKNAPIVVLDEPTAALDPISENEVYMNFDKLVQNKTAIYISHRLSSCKFCDRIIVFHDGHIIEEGSHEKLMAMKDGFYANMFNTQASQYKTS